MNFRLYFQSAPASARDAAPAAEVWRQRQVALEADRTSAASRSVHPSHDTRNGANRVNSARGRHPPFSAYVTELGVFLFILPPLKISLVNSSSSALCTKSTLHYSIRITPNFSNGVVDWFL